MKSLLCLLALATPALALAQTSYTKTAEVPLGPPDRWDYLTADAGHVFVAHGDRVTEIDPAAGVVRSVEIGAGAHGVVVIDGTVFAASGKTGTVTAFGAATGEIAARIQAAEDADALTYDPVTDRVVSVNGDSGSATIIDPKTRNAVATVEIGGGLESAAPDGTHVLIAGAEKREVVVLDTAKAAVIARWPIPDCVSPHGLAADPARHRAFVTCVDGHAVLLDTGSGTVVATLDIGHGSDAAALDPARHRFLSSNNDGTLDAIDIDEAGTPHPLPRVTTEPGARTMAIGADGRVYTATATPDGPAGTNGRYKFQPGTVRLLVYVPN